MSTTNGGPVEATASNSAPQLMVLAQYTKDLSFENPNAPGSLQQTTQPQISISVNVVTSPLSDTDIEVTLRLLEGRWRDRLTIHRDFEAVPPVECDPSQMNQVFMNLLANACDAIAGKGNVWIETRAGEHDVSVTVRDDGAGMNAEVLGRVFDPFFTTKDVGKGTGLGLAISHGVVAAHGGRIEVESTPGAGACFRVVLPVAASAVSLDTAASGGR